MPTHEPIKSADVILLETKARVTKLFRGLQIASITVIPMAVAAIWIDGTSTRLADSALTLLAALAGAYWTTRYVTHLLAYDLVPATPGTSDLT